AEQPAARGVDVEDAALLVVDEDGLVDGLEQRVALQGAALEAGLAEADVRHGVHVGSPGRPRSRAGARASGGRVPREGEAPAEPVGRYRLGGSLALPGHARVICSKRT